MKKGFFLSSVTLLALSALASCGSSSSGGGGSKTSLGTIKIWCDEKIVDLVKTEVNEYKASSSYDFTLTVEPQSESSAAGDMITDPKAGADIFFFAQDQLSRLITAKAVSDLASDAATTVKANNDEESVKAATVDNKLYAYPATADNTYFMYYDKSVMGNTDITDFNAIVAKAKAANKTVYFNTSSAWYNAAFFYGAGAHSEWTVDSKGNFIDYDDNYNSAEGVRAIKAMHTLFSDTSVHIDDSKNGAFGLGAAVLVSGTWAKNDVKQALGNNFGVAILPKVTVEGATFQLKPFSGYKLIGAKPQTDANRAVAVKEIALMLSGEAAQLARFNQNGWAPTNKNVQNKDEVKNDEVTKVVFAQNAVSASQGQYPGKWWDLAGALGAPITLHQNTIDANKLLKSYSDSIVDLKS